MFVELRDRHLVAVSRQVGEAHGGTVDDCGGVVIAHGAVEICLRHGARAYGRTPACVRPSRASEALGAGHEHGSRLSADYVVGGAVCGGVLLGGVDTVERGVLTDVGGLPTVLGVLLGGGGGAVAPTVLGGAVVG